METTNVDEQAQNMAGKPILCEGESVGEAKAIRIDEKGRVEATAAAEERLEKRARVQSSDSQPAEVPISIEEAGHLSRRDNTENEELVASTCMGLIPQINKGIRAAASHGALVYGFHHDMDVWIEGHLQRLYPGFKVEQRRVSKGHFYIDFSWKKGT